MPPRCRQQNVRSSVHETSPYIFASSRRFPGNFLLSRTACDMYCLVTTSNKQALVPLLKVSFPVAHAHGWVLSQNDTLSHLTSTYRQVFIPAKTCGVDQSCLLLSSYFGGFQPFVLNKHHPTQLIADGTLTGMAGVVQHSGTGASKWYLQEAPLCTMSLLKFLL